MRPQRFVPLAALMAPKVFAQSLSDLPACAQQAGLSGIEATGCSVTDITCICNAVPFINTLRSYIETQCDTLDQASALMFAQKLCSTVGVTISATVSGLSLSPTTMMPTTTPTQVDRGTSMSGIVTSMTYPSYAGAVATTSTSPPVSTSMTGAVSATIVQYTGGATRLGQELVAGVVALGILVAVL